MNYHQEIEKIDNFIRQEHYKEAGNTMGGILESALRDSYLSMKIKSTAKEQKILLEFEEKHGKGKAIHNFGLGQLLGLYRDGKVFHLIEKYNNVKLNLTHRLSLNDLNDIRIRCAHPSKEFKITLDELEFFLSNLKILLKELGILEDYKTVKEIGTNDNKHITCASCEKECNKSSNFCPFCGFHFKANVNHLNWADYKISNCNIKIDGKYITKFEDIVDGENVIVKAKAELFHKDDAIVGSTSLNDNTNPHVQERSWRIEGKISSNGYFYGIYFAENPVDPGIGNFFLKIYNDKSMEGLWAGYDSVNEKIASGRYSFRPIYEGYDIIHIKNEHIPQIILISDIELGKDFFADHQLRSAIEDKENIVFWVAINRLDNKVIGFVLCYVCSLEEATKIIFWPENNTPKSFAYSRKIGLIKSIVVRKEYQGYGVGSRLVEEVYEDLKQKGVDSFCSIAWKNEKKVNVEGILTSLGFNAYAEIDNYWKAQSDELGYHCPSCGAPPCTCTGVIFTRHLFE